MKKVVIGAIMLGIASLGYSQNSDCGKNVIHLTEVEVSPVDQNYLNNVDGGAVSVKVLDLQKRASKYNIKESSFYDLNSNKNETYVVRFTGDNGKILATYDQSGKIVNSRENYNDIVLPPAIRNAAFKAHPDWTVYGTNYSVNYNGNKTKKMYKVQMKKHNEIENFKYNIDGKRVN